MLFCKLLLMHIPVQSKIQVHKYIQGGAQQSAYALSRMASPSSTGSSYSRRSSHTSLLRGHFHAICEILNASETNLRSLTTELYSKRVIDFGIKNDVLRKSNANTLLDGVMLKLEHSPINTYHQVLRIMSRQELLQPIVSEIRQQHRSLNIEEDGNTIGMCL